MITKKDVFMIIKVGITLFLITAISAGILALVNEFTAPVISENNAKRQKEAMMIVMPEAVDFTLINDEFNAPVKEVYTALNEDKAVVGYAVMVSPYGYGGEISLVVGINNSLEVTGIDVTAHSETPGLGSKCDTDEFKQQFISKTFEIGVAKKNPADNEIDAISSATITSKAVTKGVNQALTVVKSLMEGN